MMLEQDYKDLALKRANTNVETNHWNYVLDNHIWVSKDNTETPFKQLDTAHLQHIVIGLLDFKHPLCAEIAKEMIDIISERAIENNKKAQKTTKLTNTECWHITINKVVDIDYLLGCFACFDLETYNEHVGIESNRLTEEEYETLQRGAINEGRHF